MTFSTKLYTWLHGRQVGSDAAGNRYYETRNAKKGAQPKRWVLYQGYPEPSKVPALWHGWLHYSTDVRPTGDETPLYAWEKPHMPNFSGTKVAYVPPGHILRGGERDAVEADYEAWRP